MHSHRWGKKKKSHEERTCNLCPGNAFDNHKQYFSLYLSIMHSRIARATITLYFFLWWEEPHIITDPKEYQSLIEIMLFFNYFLHLSQRRTKTEKENRQVWPVL